MSYNTDLQENNATLQSILEVAQTLPTHGVNYSTEETLTGGTWIDGKPIYRKTFTYNITATGHIIIATISNLGTVVNLQGNCLTSAGLYVPANIFFVSADYCFFVYLNANDLVVSASTNYFGLATVTLEYTKVDNSFTDPV